MSLQLVTSGADRLITVTGEIDMSNAHLIVELAELALRDRLTRLVLDLSGVTFFSAHGIAALLHVREAAVNRAIPLLLADPAPCVTCLAALAGVLSEFTLEAGQPQPLTARQQVREPVSLAPSTL
ncbi:STAS domain-containing protein [Micromonospora sp. NPDC049891]|uniref:STAS domain-containing protein n=1 Tax=Micromonospora sp. NPDC049891 TaxID=3155655 RepID=UPI0033ED86EE